MRSHHKEKLYFWQKSTSCFYLKGSSINLALAFLQLRGECVSAGGIGRQLSSDTCQTQKETHFSPQPETPAPCLTHSGLSYMKVVVTFELLELDLPAQTLYPTTNTISLFAHVFLFSFSCFKLHPLKLFWAKPFPMPILLCGHEERGLPALLPST